MKEASLKCFEACSQIGSFPDVVSPEFLVKWWQASFEFLNHRLCDDVPSIRAITLDIFSQISAEAFSSFPEKQQLSLLSIIPGMLQDPESSVRAAACGALGTFVTFECVQQNSVFMSDVSDLFPSHVTKDDSLLVRTRSSWALANFCQSLASSKS